MADEKVKKKIIIEIDIEMYNLLKKLESRIKVAAWDGIDKIDWKTLTRILARKVNAVKLIK